MQFFSYIKPEQNVLCSILVKKPLPHKILVPKSETEKAFVPLFDTVLRQSIYSAYSRCGKSTSPQSLENR